MKKNRHNYSHHYLVLSICSLLFLLHQSSPSSTSNPYLVSTASMEKWAVSSDQRHLMQWHSLLGRASSPSEWCWRRYRSLRDFFIRLLLLNYLFDFGSDWSYSRQVDPTHIRIFALSCGCQWHMQDINRASANGARQWWTQDFIVLMC